MESEKLKKLVNDIITNLSDQSRVTDLLNQIQEDNDNSLNTMSTLNTENEKLKGDNENLRSVNMKFFLKLGEQKEKIETNTEQEQEQEQELKFEDLFNEKGELK